MEQGDTEEIYEAAVGKPFSFIKESSTTSVMVFLTQLKVDRAMSILGTLTKNILEGSRPLGRTP